MWILLQHFLFSLFVLIVFYFFLQKLSDCATQLVDLMMEVIVIVRLEGRLIYIVNIFLILKVMIILMRHIFNFVIFGRA